jgi:uncharacterized membrane protein (UPF0127 family)
MTRNNLLTSLILAAIFIVGSVRAADLATGSVELKGKRFQIEIANDDASRERGLMFRDVMGSDHGMLFLFPDAERQTFWMKNTHISLDIFYFDANRKLVNVQQRVPPCLSTDNQCPVYPSTGPAKYVLELNGGSAEKLGVKPGDELTIHL